MQRRAYFRPSASVAPELLYSARGRADYDALADDLLGFPNLSVDDRVEAKARRAQAALARRGQHRGPTAVDLLIAAIAEAHGVILLHYDRHFDLIARATGQEVEWLARRGALG
ncbi:MAG TPA: PIN domain-containing protein [Gaiellaceae bacterium]